MPLWKFQTVGRERLDFLYANTGAGNTIILRPGVAFCFRLSGTFDLNFRAVDSTELPRPNAMSTAVWLSPSMPLGGRLSWNLAWAICPAKAVMICCYTENDAVGTLKIGPKFPIGTLPLTSCLTPGVHFRQTPPQFRPFPSISFPRLNNCLNSPGSQALRLSHLRPGGDGDWGPALE
jgi:hypothetical protein